MTRTLAEIQADLEKANAEAKRIRVLPNNGATSYVGVPSWLYYRLVALCNEFNLAKQKGAKAE